MLEELAERVYRFEPIHVFHKIGVCILKTIVAIYPYFRVAFIGFFGKESTRFCHFSCFPIWFVRNRTAKGRIFAYLCANFYFNLNMKQMLPALLFLTHFSLSFAQITVTAATFPGANDTLRYATDIMPALSLNALITPPGGPQTWDLRQVVANQSTEIVYRPANTGSNASSFAGAELLSRNNVNETYYNVTTTRFENMGYAGLDQFGLNLQVVSRYSPALVERRAPMRFFDINQTTADVTLPFSIKDLPDIIKSRLPNLVDSLRFRVNTQRLDVVDGHGKLILPDAQYDVLREKRTEYRTVNIDAHSLLGWVNLPTNNIPVLNTIAQTDTTVSYHFFSNNTKEVVAQLTLNKALSQLTSVRIKAPKKTVATWEENEELSVATIQAFPNPAVEWVRFDCINLPTDEYTIKIFNIVGRVVWRETHTINGNKSIRLDLDQFKKGTYLYSLTNKEGRILGTKRLVILKP